MIYEAITAGGRYEIEVSDEAALKLAIEECVILVVKIPNTYLPDDLPDDAPDERWRVNAGHIIAYRLK